MKKILVLAFALIIALLVPLMASAADLQGNAEYEYTISADGKTATVTVSLNGYDKANSMMIIPDYDEDELELVEAYWLIRGALPVPWDETTGDAVIAFSDATNINKDVFEMVFEIKGDAKALDSVGGELIVKSIDAASPSDTTAKETTSPEPPVVVDPPETYPPETNQPAETAVPETGSTCLPPIEYEPVETDPPETKPSAVVPTETSSPETDHLETQLPETFADVTEASEPESSEVALPETVPAETESDNTDPPESISEETDGVENKNPSTNNNAPTDYKTEDDSGGKLVDGYMWLVALVGSIVVLGVAALIAGVIWAKKKS